jgi:cytochrome P450
MKSLPPHGDIVRIFLGSMPVYVLTRPEFVHQVLVGDTETFATGHGYDTMRKFLGNGLITADGALHRTQRRMMLPMFGHQAVAGFVPAFRKIAEDCVESWAVGQPLEFDREMDRVVITQMASAVFSSDMDQQEAKTLVDCFPEILKGTVRNAALPSALAWVPTPSNRRYLAAIARAHPVIKTLTDSPTSNSSQASNAGHRDLLSRLMAARDHETGKPMSAQQIHDEIVTFFLAGTESPGAILSWIFYQLDQNPEMARQLHAEIDGVLDGRPIELEDMRKLEYTDRIITEASRYYASWAFTRRVLKPVRLGETELSAGSVLMYSPYMLHHDPRFYTDPEEFAPDRWLHSPVKSLPRGAFVPFGNGGHRCIGESLAGLQMTVALATIASRRRLRSAPGETVRETAIAAVHPDKLLMIPDLR